jgi:IS605 OrfB family transposase
VNVLDCRQEVIHGSMNYKQQSGFQGVKEEMITYRYRIKDSNQIDWLKSIAGKVNYAWNLTQDLKLSQKKEKDVWLKLGELQKQISVEGLNSQVAQAVVKEYVKKCIQFKKSKLRWRTGKKNLGWIPCTNQNVKFNIETGDFRFMKRKFRIWYSRPVVGKIMTVSLNEDARGRWYINVVCDNSEQQEHGDRVIGIDLGCKDQLVCSDEVKYSRENLTNKYEDKLAMAQRAKKKKLTKTIHAKIKNKRLDWNHKTTTDICRTSGFVAVGDISSKKLMKTRMAKSLSDASHAQIKTMLVYKAIRHGMVCKIVSEKFSTVTCSSCSKKTGPSGLSGLGVRHWECSECGVSHDRDVNASRNILLSAQGIERQLRESHAL